MIWSITKVIFHTLCLILYIAIAIGLIWSIYTGVKSSNREKELCAKLHGQLIDLTGPTQCVKKVIYFTDEEKANAPR